MGSAWIHHPRYIRSDNSKLDSKPGVGNVEIDEMGSLKSSRLRHHTGALDLMVLCS